MTQTQSKHQTVGIDMSTSEHDIRILCPACAGGKDRKAGEKVYAGEEWGAWEYPTCYRCGRTIDGVSLVDPQ